MRYGEVDFVPRNSTVNGTDAQDKVLGLQFRRLAREYYLLAVICKSIILDASGIQELINVF